MAEGEGNAADIGRQGVEELRYLQQVYQNQFAIASNSVNMTLQEMQQLNGVQKTLENINLVEGKDVINNIGSDFYIFSRVPNPKSVLVGVGAGYVIEKDIDSSKTFVAELIKKHTENLNRLTKGRKEIEKALIEVSYRLESLH